MCVPANHPNAVFGIDVEKRWTAVIRQVNQRAREKIRSVKRAMGVVAAVGSCSRRIAERVRHRTHATTANCVSQREANARGTGTKLTDGIAPPASLAAWANWLGRLTMMRRKMN